MIICFFASYSFSEALQENKNTPILKQASLDECIQTALKNNHHRAVSGFAIEMAEAQHRQALSGYWPQVSLKGGFQRMDESANFLFPSTSFSIPAQNITFPEGVSIPVTLPGVGTIPLNSFPIPPQRIDTPAQDIKLMDEKSFLANLNAVWLLYDGGMRKGYREQAQGLIAMMKEESRRTDLEIVDTVKRYYFGSVLAIQLHQLGKDTLERMETTLNLTETMYKEGSGTVKKTDWLDNKVMVESIRSMVALLEKNELMAQAALANSMGLTWEASVKPLDSEIPYTRFVNKLEELVSSAYQYNPDWSKVEAALRSLEGAVKTDESGHYPKLALTGELHKWWNSYDAGMATELNKEGWTVGIGMEIPIFSGFLIQNKIAESRARLAKVKKEQILLKDGIGLQIKDIFFSLNAAEKSYQATQEAMKSAVENRDLNTRAYQNELVDTEKVIRAQLMESLMSAQHYKVRYDHISLQSKLHLIVGTEIIKKLEKQ
ncbi:MAG: TolC family protein [Desulfobacterales bacterium]|nr:TolC family protein [Desulfobacterales bacterium]